MNTRQLQYAIELYNSLNFSAVAERLGISQPALSKQIAALESDLGVKLFDRNTTPITVTPAGEHFFCEAKKLLYEEDQLLRSMEEFKSGKRGSLSIGISPFRSLYLIPKISKQLKEKFPDVKIVLHEQSSDILRKETAEGKYDLAIVNLPVDEALLDVTPIEPDVLVLAVPKSLAKGLPFSDSDSLPTLKLGDCDKLPFIVLSKGQEMRTLFDKAVAFSNIEPVISAEVIGVSTAWAMCREGVGATILPLQFVKHIEKGDDLLLFKLERNFRSRQPAIVTKKGQYLSKYAKYAIELLTENLG